MNSIEICREVLKLLFEYNEKNWIDSFEYFVKNIGESYDKSSAREILKIYAGAGSFNDLVLHKNGMPVGAGNDRLNQLRSQLYESLVTDIAS